MLVEGGGFVLEKKGKGHDKGEKILSGKIGEMQRGQTGKRKRGIGLLK